MRWERTNPLRSLCRLLSFVLALLYFHSDEARVMWNTQISGRFLAKIQLPDKKRGPLVKFIHCHHLLGSCGGNWPAMQYSKKWIRLHYMVRALEKVPWAITMKFASASNKCHILKAAAHVLLCFSKEHIHLFWETSLKQDSLSLVLPPLTAATNTSWEQQKANVPTLSSTCTLERSLLRGKPLDHLLVTFRNGCRKRQITCNSSQD